MYGGAALAVIAAIGVYGYFVAGTIRNFEFLLMCSQGTERLIPKRFCQFYLFHFAGSPNEIRDLNRGIGVAWALEAEQTDDKIKLLDFLLRKGARIDALDERSGLSALHAMVLYNDLEGVELLLENGANPGVRDAKSGKTPLDLARERQGKPGEPDRTKIIRRLEALSGSSHG